MILTFKIIFLTLLALPRPNKTWKRVGIKTSGKVGERKAENFLNYRGIFTKKKNNIIYAHSEMRTILLCYSKSGPLTSFTQGRPV